MGNLSAYRRGYGRVSGEALADGLGTGLKVLGNTFELLADQAQVDALIDRLRGRGVSIRGIAPRKLTLEESFIDLVRKGGQQ